MKKPTLMGTVARIFTIPIVYASIIVSSAKIGLHQVDQIAREVRCPEVNCTDPLVNNYNAARYFEKDLTIQLEDLEKGPKIPYSSKELLEFLAEEQKERTTEEREILKTKLEIVRRDIEKMEGEKTLTARLKKPQIDWDHFHKINEELKECRELYIDIGSNDRGMGLSYVGGFILAGIYNRKRVVKTIEELDNN